MSETGEGADMTASFQVAYEGRDDVHAMDAYLLAPALLGLSDVIREANRIINGEKSSVRLLVQSDFEHKCFNINFDVVMTWLESAKTFFGVAHEVKDAKEILEWLGVIGTPSSIGLFTYLKKRGGRPIKNVTKLETKDQRGMVSVEFGAGAHVEKVEVHNHIYQMGQSKAVLRGVQQSIQPIDEGRQFDRLEFRERDKARAIIKRDDLPDIKKTTALVESAPEISPPQPIDAVLRVLSPVFDENEKAWHFWYGEQQIRADISETDIARRAMERGGVAVGDMYKVRMLVSQHMTPTNQIRNTYKVTEVVEFIPAPTQNDLFHPRGTSA